MLQKWFGYLIVIYIFSWRNITAWPLGTLREKLALQEIASSYVTVTASGV
jgi:hypothetical protein